MIHEPYWRDVRRITYARHTKAGKPDSLRVTYFDALESVSEWVCLEHEGYARNKAERWWLARDPLECTAVPTTVSEALCLTGVLDEPTEIRVCWERGYLRILDYNFGQPRFVAPRKPAGWRGLLGLPPLGAVTRRQIDAAFKRLVMACHPDHGGSHEKMVALNLAREAALREAHA